MLRLVWSVDTMVNRSVRWFRPEGGSQITASQNDVSCESAHPPTNR